MEVRDSDMDAVLSTLKKHGVVAHDIGATTVTPTVVVKSPEGTVILEDSTAALRNVWAATSFELEKLQTNPACVKQEQDGFASRKNPPQKLT